MNTKLQRMTDKARQGTKNPNFTHPHTTPRQTSHNLKGFDYDSTNRYQKKPRRREEDLAELAGYVFSVGISEFLQPESDVSHDVGW